jgi:hypothetical protein
VPARPTSRSENRAGRRRRLGGLARETFSSSRRSSRAASATTDMTAAHWGWSARRPRAGPGNGFLNAECEVCMVGNRGCHAAINTCSWADSPAPTDGTQSARHGQHWVSVTENASVRGDSRRAAPPANRAVLRATSGSDARRDPTVNDWGHIARIPLNQRQCASPAPRMPRSLPRTRSFLGRQVPRRRAATQTTRLP